MSIATELSPPQRTATARGLEATGAKRIRRSLPGASSDPVRDYLDQIGRFPLLTADDEVFLAQAIELGLVAEQKLVADANLDPGLARELHHLVTQGRSAHRRFICCNLKLVVSVAKRYVGRGVPFMDLIQEGNLGLDRAVQKFDYKQGFKFSTYAMWWIRQSITRSLADSAKLIRIPVHTTEKINQLRRISRDIAGLVGRDATIEEIAAEADLVPAAAARLMGFDREPVSIHMPIGEESSSEMGDLIEDVDAASVDHLVSVTLRNAAIRRLVDLLPEREARIVKLRYGLDSEPMTCGEVGEIFGVSRERIRQLEARALSILRSSELHGWLDD